MDNETTDPSVEARIRESFERQTVMGTIGAKLASVSPGEVHVVLPFNPALVQQQGFLHAGVVTMIVDTACGYAALSRMPPGTEVVCVELKINFLAPAVGERFDAVGKVLKPGRTLTVCAGTVEALSGDVRKIVACSQTTMMAAEPALPQR